MNRSNSTQGIASNHRSNSRQVNQLLSIKLSPTRSHIAMFVFAGLFAALAIKAVYVQLVSQDFLQNEAENRFVRTQKLESTRGKILDRNGIVLASSLPARSIGVYPHKFEASTEQLQSLAKLLKMSEAEIAKRVNAAGRSYFYLQRQVDPAVGEQIAKLKIKGLDLQREFKRLYPGGEASAQVVGFTSIDDDGIDGVEHAFQTELTGQAGVRRVTRNNLGHVIDEDESAASPARAGRDLELSIDTRIQDLAFQAVKEAVTTHRAKAGSAVVIDVQTGEVLALANWPTYNPNQRKGVTTAAMRNRALVDTYEPGSTIKPFTIATALDRGKVRPSTVIATGGGKLVVGQHTLNDSHPYGDLTIEQVVQKSSNVGTARIALEMLGAEPLWSTLTQAGFGQAPQIGFPGAAAGRVRAHKNWKPVELATISYGYGISTSLLQVTRAYTAFATDGILLPVSITKTNGAPEGQRLMKPETAIAVRKMLEMAAGPQGTALQAQTIGYRVGGKTGTARKQANGVYTGKYIGSFVGIAPISAPRIVIGVMIDEPGAGKFYGGEVAAPAFSKIAQDTLRILKIQPDAPYQTSIEKSTTVVKESI